MYIDTNQKLGEPPIPECSPGSGAGDTYKPPFGSAERDITEGDARQILRILCGPSPWQPYLQSNLRAHLKDLPSKPVRIVMAGDFANKYTGIFGGTAPKDAQGFVDRKNAIMYLKEFPAGSRAKSKLGLALHEAVHLFSHPAGRSRLLRSTAYAFLGEGLLEGLTQAITEDIQKAQGIRPMRENWQAYKEYVPVAREICRIFTRTALGDAYFNGNLNNLFQAILHRWGHDQFRKVQALTNRKKTDDALQLARSLENAYAKRPKVSELRWVFR